jgi:polar amino acid transport system substrate-binding protein
MRIHALLRQVASRGRVLAFTTAVIGLAATSGAQADLLEDIKAKGEFVVGTEARFPPFEFIENGEIVGYASDILKLIMAEMPGVRLNQLDLPWQGILPGLAAKRFDYVVTSVTATKERNDAYHLSVPIADATIAVLKRKGDDTITKSEDLAGKVVGSQSGAAQLQATEAYNDKLKAAGTPMQEIRSYVDFNEAYADLGAGRISAVVNSIPNLLEAVKQRPDVFEVVKVDFGPKVYFSWAGRKDDESKSLNEFVDQQLAKLIESGKLAELQTKWFGGPMELPTALPPPEM